MQYFMLCKRITWQPHSTQEAAYGLSRLVLPVLSEKQGKCLKKQRQAPWHSFGSPALINMGSFLKVQIETKLSETASRHFEWIPNCKSFPLSNCLLLFLPF